MRLYRKARPVRDERFRAAWSRRHRFCAACGTGGEWTRLQTHHLISFGRSDEAANLLRTCLRCHAAAEGESVALSRGGRMPPLSLAQCCAIKQASDPTEWDASRLAELLGRALPDPEPVPDYFRQAFRRRRGFLPDEFLFGYSAELPERGA